jgi:DNA-dependent RNA polymerase auxiliary subunit epsilon
MKKKRFPSSIMILGRKYKIKQGKGLTFQNMAVLGLCDNNTRTIYLEKDQDEHIKKETLLHECVHALLFITGIDQKLSDGENEVYCQLFTAFYHDMEVAIK